MGFLPWTGLKSYEKAVDYSYNDSRQWAYFAMSVIIVALLYRILGWLRLLLLVSTNLIFSPCLMTEVCDVFNNKVSCSSRDQPTAMTVPWTVLGVLGHLQPLT